MVETQAYDVIKKIDMIEIRRYPEMILAQIKGYNDSQAFGILFSYISGNNQVQEKISMTAPVMNSKQIEMTTPVISKENYFAFIMPSNYTIDTLPKPVDKRIHINIETKRIMAVIKFSGYTTEKKINKYQEILLETLKKHHINIKGNAFIMRYNSPFSPPFFRRNEIGVEIEDVKN